MPLIQALQTDEWWQYVSLGMLENVHQKLRGFITIIKTAPARWFSPISRTKSAKKKPSICRDSRFLTYTHDQGVEGVFKGPEIDELISILEEVKNRAIA